MQTKTRSKAPTNGTGGPSRYKENGYSLGPNDPANFLKLASALNISLSDKLTDNQIHEVDTLIREYNVELIEVSRTPQNPSHKASLCSTQFRSFSFMGQV